ncbi:MAG TPA: hypothetical protein DCQ06_00115 [Myxococcales bacterium]|nr:hypothetical protein [Myxococcales bacterium]HAN29974.1 hypothetical protein [Myxococcales bacterium]
MPTRPTIVIDSYGGVDSPLRALRVAADLSLTRRVQIVLVGHAPVLHAHLATLSYDPANLRLVGTSIDYPPHTGDHLAEHRVLHRTLPLCLSLLEQGEGDALVTAASESVVWQVVTERCQRIRADIAPAMAAVIPTLARSSSDDPFALVLDVSGNSSANARQLRSWAALGGAYSRVVSGVRRPEVALLSTGRDQDQGPQSVTQAYRALQTHTDIQFVGNIQAVDIPRGLADVVVCDGFTGNAVRGVLEGVTQLTVEAARYAWRSKFAWRAGLRLLSSGVGMLKQVSEFQRYGGAPILGLQQLVFVTQPDASQLALENGVRLAAKCVDRELLQALELALEQVPKEPS